MTYNNLYFKEKEKKKDLTFLQIITMKLIITLLLFASSLFLLLFLQLFYCL